MNWDEVKMQIDDAITEQLGAGFNAQDVEIDWIDFSADITNIEINEDFGVITLRIT
jgi:hypothetical protein